MPAVAKTSQEEVISAARELLEERGEKGLTVQAVAERVGVRGPSLYKRFPDRGALIRTLETEALLEITRDLEASDGTMNGMAAAYLGFARRCPALYSLMFKAGDDVSEFRAAAIRPVLSRLTEFLGDPGAALTRARVLVAFLHGYALMEAAGAFRLGGDLSNVVPTALKLVVPEA